MPAPRPDKSPALPLAPVRGPKSLVMSLANGFRVPEAFEENQPELTFTEIAHRADRNAGTAFRLGQTLMMLGYLREACSRRFPAARSECAHRVPHPAYCTALGHAILAHLMAAEAVGRILSLAGCSENVLHVPPGDKEEDI